MREEQVVKVAFQMAPEDLPQAALDCLGIVAHQRIRHKPQLIARADDGITDR